MDTIIGGISGALGASGINQVISAISSGVSGIASSVGGNLIASNGDWSKVNVGKAMVMGVLGTLSGWWAGAGIQNSSAMSKSINVGKSWGSKAFLSVAGDVSLRPNSGLALQNMYDCMAKAITRYALQGTIRVSSGIFLFTFLGGLWG